MNRRIAFFALALTACTNGQGQADVTLETTVALGGVPAQVQGAALPTPAVTTDGAITVDAREELQSMAKLGSLSATIAQNTLAGAGLTAIQHIKTTIAAEDGTLPVELLTDVDVPPNSAALDLPLLISANEVLKYLKEGKVEIHFYVTGVLSSQPIRLTHTLVAHVVIAVQGSVLKL